MTSRALAALIDTVHGLREEVDGLKAPQLGHSSLEDASLMSYRGDQLSAQIGTLYDGSSGIAVLAGPPPPTPSWTPEGIDPLPPGQAVAGGYVFRWSGKWVDLPAVPPDTAATPQVAPANFSRVELHVSTSAVFSAMTFDTMASSTSSSRGGTWFIKADDFLPRYACLVARTVSGGVSARSEIIGPFVAGKIEQNMLDLDLGQIGGVDSFAGPNQPTTDKVGSLWLREPDDRLHRYDGSSWVPFQDADVQAAIEAASDAAQAAAGAQGTANNALTLAGEAGSAADVALTAANGKTKVLYSTVNPTVGSLTPGQAGDIWYRRDAQGWIRATYEHVGDTGDAATRGWRFRQFADDILGSLTAGKITTGTLGAAVSITIGSPTSNRVVLSGSNGIQGIQRVDGIDVVNFGFDIASGSGVLRGSFQSLANSGRSIVLDGNLNVVTGASGKAAGQPGLVFPSNAPDIGRYGQLYDNSNAVAIDSPAYTTTLGDGINRGGSSIAVEARGFFVYTEGADTNTSNADAMQIRNDGVWRLGRADIAGRTMARGFAGEWFLGNVDAGTRVWGRSDGYWEIGDINTAKPSIFGNATAIEMINDFAATRVGLPDTGEWIIGHAVGQAVYSRGKQLIIRDRQISGNREGGIVMNVAPGSWFDVYPSDAPGVEGGMYVHGRFGSPLKNFRIDHPVDPDRELVHGCTESPQAGVEYWGVTELDKKGEAVVELPGYFEALTHREGRAVIVTAVGRPVPVGAEEIEGGRFTVYGAPNGKVSWLVKAVRRGVEFEVEPLRPAAEERVEAPERTKQDREKKPKDRGNSPRPPRDESAGNHGWAVIE